MKTKLELADGFALKAIELGCSFELDELVSKAWGYADLMHAEAEKREPKGLPDVLNDELPSGFSFGGYVEPRAHTSIGVVSELKGANSSQLEWQPDWSQAREDMEYFAVDMSGDGYFYSYKPVIAIGYDYWVMGVYEASETATLCEIHNYKGEWQESLRKRP